jgi:hypothetical protein
VLKRIDIKKEAAKGKGDGPNQEVVYHSWPWLKDPRDRKITIGRVSLPGFEGTGGAGQEVGSARWSTLFPVK